MLSKLTKMYIQHRLKGSENNKPISKDKDEDDRSFNLKRKETKDSRRIFRS